MRDLFGDGLAGVRCWSTRTATRRRWRGRSRRCGRWRWPGYAPSLVDSGCCGMAGSFGFEREHYGVSREMGAYRLFPAVEAAGGEVAIAVTGVSCRQQIGHFTSRKPRHVAELLAGGAGGGLGPGGRSGHSARFERLAWRSRWPRG